MVLVVVDDERGITVEERRRASSKEPNPTKFP